MKRQWAKTLFVIGALVFATGPATTASAAPAAAAAPAAKTAAASATFPVTVVSGDGAVTVPSRPTRILCLSASATQMLYAMGAGPQVVGVDKYSTYPPNAPRTKFTGAETNAEDYLYLHPDLVIFAYSEGTLVKQLKDLHIPALVLGPASTFAGIDNQIALLGKATGRLAGARAEEGSLNAFLARSASRAANAGKGKTYYIELSPGPDYYTATSGTFIGAELSLFGMRDIANPAGHGSDYPEISAQYILKANPDYIFLADTVCCKVTVANFARRPGFGSLGAVRLHHVIGVNDSVASQWGPHTVELFVGVISKALHP